MDEPKPDLDATVVTSPLIWDSYRSLHRYFSEHNPDALHPTAKIPVAIGARPGTSLAREAAKRAVNQLECALATHPIPVPPMAQAYLFLWAQTLRVSRPFNPIYLDMEKGWRNIVWRPLHVLIPRENPDKAQSAWRAFYQQFWFSQGDTADPTVFQAVFPWYPESKDLQAEEEARQIRQLHRLMEKHESDAVTVVRNMDTLGQARVGFTSQYSWNPKIIAACPSVWEPLDSKGSYGQTNKEIIGFVSELLAGTQVGLVDFRTRLVPAVNKVEPGCDKHREILAAIRDGIDSILEPVDGESPAPELAKRWTHAKETFLIC